MLRDDRQSYDFSETGLWPTESQELLLQAALWRGERALRAWELWRSMVNLDDEMDRGTFRLLPMLYKSMLALGIQDPLMQKLGSVYRWAWVESNQILRYMKPTLEGLRCEGIPTLLLKGAPLAYDFYEYPGMRPMADFDVLVSLEDVAKAIDYLSRSGWKPRTELSASVFDFRHSLPFYNEADQEFDLHWHVLPEICNADVDGKFWRNSVPFRVDEIQSRRLDTTDSLLHAVVHGIRWNPEPPIRWIADAMVLLDREPGTVDWDRLTGFAQRHGLAYRLTLGLRYLKERMAADIPDWALRRLQECHITFLERLESIGTLTAAQDATVSLLGGIMSNFCTYQRIAVSRPDGQSAPGFLNYLCFRRKLQRRRELGAWAARHAWRWGKRRLGLPQSRAPVNS